MAFAARLVTLGLLLLIAPAHAASDADRTVKPIRIAGSGQSAIIKGAIKGYAYVDHQLRAGAGQRLVIGMQPGNRANYFNVLPPNSQDAAMFTEGAGDRRFDGLLPDDGVYTVRVYLLRAAARRNETSNYSLSVKLGGTPLRALPAKSDALIPGTRYHASAKIRCEPPYATVRECDAWVVRRGVDGTATVEVRWDKTGKRRILFIKGKPEAADTPQPFTVTRDDKGTVIVFGPDERFEIPDPLIFGG
jgi:hypothetical protein